MRHLPLISLAAAACASSGATGSAPAPSTQTVEVVGAASSVRLSMPGRDASTAHTLPFSVDQVWRALPAALDSLGIPVETLDPAKRTMGNSSFAARRRLKAVPLSRYVDCGATPMGPNADEYDVRLTVLTAVRPAEGGGATVTTTVQAAARPANYSQAFSDCSSRGVLETRLVELLTAQLQR